MRTAFDDRGAEVALRLDYEAAAKALLAAWRGQRGLPDFTLPHEDAPAGPEVQRLPGFSK